MTQSIKKTLADLITHAISSDENGAGFVTAMAKKNAAIQQDIPAAFETYTIVSHYMATLPTHAATLGKSDTLLTPSINVDLENGKVVALIPIGADELPLIAFWISNNLVSPKVRALPGLLALPLVIETHGDTQHLIPEWFATFYVDGSEEHCVPMLSLRSVTDQPEFGDWVSIAFERMSEFGLPCSTAKAAAAQFKAKMQ